MLYGEIIYYIFSNSGRLCFNRKTFETKPHDQLILFRYLQYYLLEYNEEKCTTLSEQFQYSLEQSKKERHNGSQIYIGTDSQLNGATKKYQWGGWKVYNWTDLNMYTLGGI